MYLSCLELGRLHYNFALENYMKNESGMPETYVVVANSRVIIKVKQEFLRMLLTCDLIFYFCKQLLVAIETV